ncbi:MAG: AAA family ATPase [Treponemataceae bacterium]
MTDLFDSKKSTNEPLAARMRPRNLDEFIGQDHIVGKGRLLRRAIAADQLTSVIFYGPPGTGKTTLARVIAAHTKSNFLTLNAVLAGVQNIRESILQADTQRKMYDRKTILFVDEVHRWNKSQQDALLPWVENGTIILVGATTENPFFEVNKALVSRSRVFQLKPLNNDDLYMVVKATLADKERGYGKWNVQFEKGALEHLVETANGDARSLLNALELAVETTPEKWPANNGESIFISQTTAEESIQKKAVLYDRDGDYHYDVISAFIKSVRGRDPDAALYWLARMVQAGEDPHFIFRRLLISACEDTGLADPHAISVVESCARSFDRIGFPEGKFHLAHATLYLATAPKSNSSLAFFDALNTVKQEDAEVPNHLKDSSRDAEGFGHGKGYMYPHAYRDHWVSQQYLPDALMGKVFYTPSNQGYEKTIQQDVFSRRELQIASILSPQFDDLGDFSANCTTEHHQNNTKTQRENLTFTQKNKKLDQWHKRTDENRSDVLLTIRNTLLDFAQIVRHNTNLMINADDGLFLWELYRRSPEGFTAGFCSSNEGKIILEQYAQTLPELERPMLFTPREKNLSSQITEFIEQSQEHEIQFDNIIYKDPITSLERAKELSEEWKDLLQKSTICNKDTKIIFSQKIVQSSEHLSSIFNSKIYQHRYKKNQEVIDKYKTAENLFYTSEKNMQSNWTEADLQKIFCSPSRDIHSITKKIAEIHYIDEQKIQKWFNMQNNYAQSLQENLSSTEIEFIKNELIKLTTNTQSFTFNSTYAFFVIDINHQ